MVVTLWRFVDTGVSSAYLNMAIDEAILDHHLQDSVPPTLRVYTWDPPALSIGYSQPIKQIDLKKCSELGIDVVRRPTGGRATFHNKELTYSVVVGGRYGFPQSVIASYKLLSRGLIAFYRHLGLDTCLGASSAPFSSPSCFATATLADLTYQGCKISGSAQVRRGNALLQHGSLPIDLDVETLFLLLKFPSEISRQDALTTFSQKSISLGEILGDEIDLPHLKKALLNGFHEALGIQFYKSDLTEEEILWSQKLALEKYSLDAWNYRK
jgi:lipoate-protein ligase A